jgi:Arabinose efflux permease
VSGLGTFIGYGLRLLTGYIADKKKNYWIMTIIGYAIDLLCIPFLALIPENGWILACGLLLIGKVGNAVKKPAKDTMVSFATSEQGEGKGFAILEFVDQIGAFLGPTVLFLIMFLTTDMTAYQQYRIGFAALAVPALGCLALLFVAKRKFPKPEQYEKEIGSNNTAGLKKTYVVYLVGACLFAFGFIDFPLITAYQINRSLVPTDYLPLLYSGAMLADAFSALFFGVMYDKHGFWTLFISAVVSAPFAIIIFFTDNLTWLLVGVVLWGVGMGAQESIMKSAIATLTDKDNRSKGYGVFQLCFGVFWFVGSWLTGTLYDVSITAMIAVSISAQLIAVVVFAVIAASSKRKVDII